MEGLFPSFCSAESPFFLLGDRKCAVNDEFGGEAHIFPQPCKMIYLDNNATTRIAQEAFEAMQPFFRDEFFNPSSMYEPARNVSHALLQARETISKHIGAKSPSELLFTSCATESINTATFGLVRAVPNRKHIITTAVEHPAVLETCKQLARDGFDVTFLGVDKEGNLDLGEYVRAIRQDTLLVSIMHANNESGVIFPIERLARIAKETDETIRFHCDATQSMTKLPISMTGNFRHVDFLSFSGHKFHAPKGIGALYIRRGTPCKTLLIGGHQEHGRRGGTENVPYIVAMAAAMQTAAKTHDEDMQHIGRLRNKLQDRLTEKIPYLEINGKNAVRMPNTLNVGCHYIEGEGILYQLSAEGICASSGSACTSGSLEPSHVLSAMHVPFSAMHGSVRFSLSRYTTEAEIDRTIDVFPEIVAKLRRLSPYWDQANNKPRGK